METAGLFAGDVIPDEETAKKVATAVVQGIAHNQTEKKYIPQHVFFDDEEKVWQVILGPDTDELVLGGGCTVWIQQSDGKILKVQFGE